MAVLPRTRVPILWRLIEPGVLVWVVWIDVCPGGSLRIGVWRRVVHGGPGCCAVLCCAAALLACACVCEPLSRLVWSHVLAGCREVGYPGFQLLAARARAFLGVHSVGVCARDGEAFGFGGGGGEGGVTTVEMG